MKLPLILIFLLIGASVSAKEVELRGRVEVQKDSCEICLGCEERSGRFKATFQCKAEDFIPGLKYQVNLSPVLKGNDCVLTQSAPAQLLPPEAKLPQYLQLEDLKKQLSCE